MAAGVTEGGRPDLFSSQVSECIPMRALKPGWVRPTVLELGPASDLTTRGPISQPGLRAFGEHRSGVVGEAVIL